MRSAMLAIRKQPTDIDVILLLLRLVIGNAFIIFGWGKIQHPGSWMGPGSAFPGIFQALAAISEFAGGIALIIGLLTRIAAFGIGCTMAVAVYMLRFEWGVPFVSTSGGNSYVLPSVLLVIALLLLLAGPGRYSLDRIIFGVRE